MKTMKLLKAAAAAKEEAGEVFKSGNFEAAIETYNEVLKLDPLNLTFNSTLCLNKAICQVKLGLQDDALATLNLCLRMNPEYAKALVKRGEVYQNLKEWEEAVDDYSAASNIDPAGF